MFGEVAAEGLDGVDPAPDPAPKRFPPEKTSFAIFLEPFFSSTNLIHLHFLFFGDELAAVA